MSTRTGPASPPVPLTPRQREIFAYIWEYLLAHAYQPTMREIGEHFGIGSPNGVACTLRALEAKGWIELNPLGSGGVGARVRSVGLRKTMGGRPFAGLRAIGEGEGERS